MPKGQKFGGRTKGTPNKKTSSVLEKCEQLGVDPIDVLLNFAKGDWKALGYDSPTHVTGYLPNGDPIVKERIPPELRQKSAKDASEYIHPKRKAIEMSGELATTPISIEQIVKERLKKKNG